MDISTGGTKFTEPYKSVLYALEKGVKIGSITFSSDGNGGIRKYDPANGIDTYTLAPLHLNLAETVRLIKDGGLSEADAFKLTTENAAKTVKLGSKGYIREGFDADLCMFDDSYKITDVISMGEVMLRDGAVVMQVNFE